MAKIYFYDFSHYEGNIENLYLSLDEDDKKELKNIKNERKKRQFAFSRFLLRYALNENGYEKEKIIKNKYGKPYFASGFPYFNISHSENAVCVALSEREIGIDVQKRKEISKKLIAGFFSNEEEKIIREGITTDCDLWSIKESILKYDGTGIVRFADDSKIMFSGKKIFIKDRPELKISNFSDYTYAIYLWSTDAKNVFYNVG